MRITDIITLNEELSADEKAEMEKKAKERDAANAERTKKYEADKKAKAAAKKADNKVTRRTAEVKNMSADDQVKRYKDAGRPLTGDQEQRIRLNPKADPRKLDDTHADVHAKRKAVAASDEAEGKTTGEKVASVKGKAKENDLTSTEERNAIRRTGGSGDSAAGQAGAKNKRTPTAQIRKDGKSDNSAVRKAANKEATAQSDKATALSNAEKADARDKAAKAEKAKAKGK